MPTEIRCEIPGKVGVIEGVLHQPSTIGDSILVMCHPHPLYQGSMDNKVVTTVCRHFADQGTPSIRFNYRGVGKSGGVYGDGTGESVDARAVVEYAKSLYPDKKLILAGFSFGGFVAYNIAIPAQATSIILISPSVAHFDMQALSEPKASLLVIQGDADDIVPHSKVAAWLSTRKREYRFVTLAGASHFFHGRLRELKEAL